MKRSFLLVILLIVIPDLGYAQPSCPNYALHTAVIEGNSSILETTVSLYANTGLCNINGKNFNAVTPLHLAVLKGDPEMVRILLDNGANVFEKDAFGNEAVVWADITDNDQIIFILNQKKKELLQGSLHEEISWVKWYKNNGPNMELIEMMIEAGADVNEISETANWPVLHTLINDYTAGDLFNADRDYIMHLLINAGADVNATDNYELRGLTPLHAICTKFDIPNVTNVIEMLLEAGADVNAKGRHIDATPLHRIVSWVSKYSEYIAIHQNEISYSEYETNIERAIKIIEMLIDYGADVHAKTSISFGTPLYQIMLAISNNSGNRLINIEHAIKIVEILLEAGSDVQAIDARGNLMLEDAQKEITNFLENAEYMERIIQILISYDENE